jgi:hypothetical protein
MGGMTDVYGVKVPKNAAKDSKMFMNMQFGWCGCGLCGKIITFILTLVVHFRMEAIGNKMDMGGMPGKSDDAVSMLKKAHFHSMWISEIFQMIIYIFIGLTFIYCARKMLADRNVNCFCCLEGCCSVWLCCSGCMACISLGMFIALAGALSDPTALCNHPAFNATWPGAANTTFPPVPITGLNTSIANTANSPFLSAFNTTAITTTAFDKQKCIDVVNILKSLMSIACLFIAFMAVQTCIQSLICGLGAKYAKDAQDEFDDAEESEDLE